MTDKDYSTREAAEMLGVSVSFFSQKIRPLRPIGRREAVGTIHENFYTLAELNRIKATIGKQNQGRYKIQIPESILAQLGKKPDTELAKAAGVSSRTIKRRREAKGIPAWTR